MLLTADLIFLVSGGSAFSGAITDATAPGEYLQFDHVAIVYVDATGATNVIEANPEAGVQMIPFDEFLPPAESKSDTPRAVVKRLNIDFPAEQSVRNAFRHIGEDYDWWYMPDNGKTYCSELIYDCYLDAGGNPIFEAKPMNFRAEDGSMPEFWTDLYSRLGVPVPEGIPGTNPQDLSKSPYLTETYRFF